MRLFAILAALALLGFAGLDHVVTLHQRILHLERLPRSSPGRLSRLDRDLNLVQRELREARTELASGRATEELLGRLSQVEALLHDTSTELTLQETRMASWEETWGQADPSTFNHDLAMLRGVVADQRQALKEVATEAAETVGLAFRDLELLRENISRHALPEQDKLLMWEDLLGPTVQLSGDNTVGSGVLLAPRPAPNGEGYQTYLITAWHVVRDIYADPEQNDMPVPVKIYQARGGTWAEKATLIARDAELDMALLLLCSESRLDCGAQLASRDRLREVRTFDPIYAVGCPLGNDPIPTRGEIAATQHTIDGQSYWMISAPTYIGNSGGGVFDADTHELLGIFSKIYTHGSMRATIVPHMGLVTPLGKIYDWLGEIGYAHLETSSDHATPQVAAAPAPE